MTPVWLPPPEDVEAEVAALIQTLHTAEKRLEELTGGEVDTVSAGSGQPFLLRRAQGERRDSEVARQVAILNALPAHIALLDGDGVIVSVNATWREFARANVFVDPAFGVGINYLELCAQTVGPEASEARAAAEGIRGVLANAGHFSLEYACHSPNQPRWFSMTVTPLPGGQMHGAIVMHMDITERKLAAVAFEELSQKTARRERILTTTLSSLNDFAYIYDRRGCFLFANQALLDLLGVSLEYLVGRNFSQLGYPADLAARLQRQIQEVFESKRTLTDETPFKSPSGVDGFYEYIFSPAFGADGTVEFVVGSTRDVSERKRTESALRESNRKFQQLTDNITDAFWIRSADFSELHYMSPAFERIWGRSVSSLQANPRLWLEFIVPEDRERVVAGFAALTDLAPNLEIEYRIARPDGEIRWLNVRSFQVRDSTTAKVRHVGITVDVTERVKAAAELQTSLIEFRVLAESMPQIVWSTRPDGANVYFNPQWTDYTGLTLAESLGAGWIKPFHPEDQPRATDAWAKAVATGGLYSLECRLRRVDGAYRWWLIRGLPIVDEAGRILKWFGSCTDIHDLKMAAVEVTIAMRAVRAAESKYRSLFENSTEGIFQTSVDGQFLAANPAMARMAGFDSPAELIRERTDIGRQGYVNPAVRKRFQRLIESQGAVTGFEYELRRKDGTAIWVSENSRAIRDHAGKASYYEGSVQDITAPRLASFALHSAEKEQRQLARKLALESARLIEAQSVAKVGSWETNLRTFEVTWSAETFRIFERDVAEGSLSHQDFLKYVHPDDRLLVDAAFAASVEQRSPGSITHRIVLRGGGIKFVEERWKPDFDERQQLIAMTGTCQDVTARERDHASLQTSEKRFKALFEQAAIGVAQSDAKTGRFVQINQRFCQMLGRTREQLEQLTFGDVTHPDDVALSLEFARQIRSGIQRETTMEKRYLREDASEVWANVTVSAMWVPGDEPDYFIAVAQDVTGQKKMADQFRQAQKMEAIGTLAGGIAHDFNNILAAINGYTELSQMQLTGNPEVRSHLGAVLKASSRATDLVRQILTFSRQQRVERRPIQLQPIVTEAFKLLRASIPSMIEFEISLKDAPVVLADATQIHQLLMNLGTNAWHAMRERTGKLQVKLERFVVDAANVPPGVRLHPGEYARLSVSDTGRGMDAQTLKRIFEPFFTTKPVGEGTGLGLAVVHGIMATHDGAVTVYSQPDEGTVFHLYFPAIAAAVPAVPELGDLPTGHGERILLVDDEQVLVEMSKLSLTALGYEVEVTTQPEAALAMVRADPHRFALVITDQTMPVMTGMDLAQQLLQLRPGLPIIIMTGYGLALTPERVKAAGLRDVLLKPTTIHSFGAAVHAAVSAGKIG